MSDNTQIRNDGAGLRIDMGDGSGAYHIGHIVGDLPATAEHFHTILLRAFNAGRKEGKAEIRRALAG